MIANAYNSQNYRYGFNGYENDDEIKGGGNSVDFGARIYDSRIAKFLSIDPLVNDFPFWSPYNFAANCPIKLIDIQGMGPGEKCEECGNASEKNVGDSYTKETDYYSINYVVKEENGVKFWDIVESNVKTENVDKLSEDKKKEVLKDYFDKTGYVKIQEAYPNTFSERLKVFLPGGNSFEYTIDAEHPTITGVLIDILHPLPSSTITRWDIDNEGFIHIPDGYTEIHANIVSGLKALGKAKRMADVVRDSRYFKNSSPLQKMLANYWKKSDQVGGGGTAAMLLHEFQSGKQLAHLDKAIGYRKAFMRALRGEYGKLNPMQKEVIIRELKHMQNVFDIITR
jgi:RHS repeat-associated protein